MMDRLTPEVKELILQMVNDAMEHKDRYVTINFSGGGPFVTIYPLEEMYDGEVCISENA